MDARRSAPEDNHSTVWGLRSGGSRHWSYIPLSLVDDLRLCVAIQERINEPGAIA
jgi:hypothetical protein